MIFCSFDNFSGDFLVFISGSSDFSSSSICLSSSDFIHEKIFSLNSSTSSGVISLFHFTTLYFLTLGVAGFLVFLIFSGLGAAAFALGTFSQFTFLT